MWIARPSRSLQTARVSQYRGQHNETQQRGGNEGSLELLLALFYVWQLDERHEYLLDDPSPLILVPTKDLVKRRDEGSARSSTTTIMTSLVY